MGKIEQIVQNYPLYGANTANIAARGEGGGTWGLIGGAMEAAAKSGQIISRYV